MSMLTNELRKIIADELVFSAQAKSFHWNVRGMFFSELHSFFEEIYSGSYGTIDAFAEYIRQEKEMAPFSVADMYKDRTLQEINYVPGTSREMLSLLRNSNITVIATLNSLMKEATSADNQALMNFIAEVMDMHNKWNWMLSSYLEE